MDAVDHQYSFLDLAGCLWYHHSKKVHALRLSAHHRLCKSPVQRPLSSRNARKDLTRDPAVPQYRRDSVITENHRTQSRTTHHGPFSAAEYPAIQLHPLDCTDCQHHRRCIPQMVHLFMAPSTELFENVPGHCLVLHSHGHSSELSGTCIDPLWLRTVQKELERYVSR